MNYNNNQRYWPTGDPRRQQQDQEGSRIPETQPEVRASPPADQRFVSGSAPSYSSTPANTSPRAERIPPPRSERVPSFRPPPPYGGEGLKTGQNGASTHQHPSGEEATGRTFMGEYNSQHTSTNSMTGSIPYAPVDQHSIGIFWDYENIHIPSGFRNIDVMEMADRIRHAVSDFGYGEVIDEKNIYLDKRDGQCKNEVELWEANFEIIDCPTKRTQDGTVIKEAVDKIIISAMWRFAYMARANNKKCCMVLIASDGDYTNMISAQRDMGIKVIVWHGGPKSRNDTHIDRLTMAATSSAHFLQEILCMASPERQPLNGSFGHRSAAAPGGGGGESDDDTMTVASAGGGRFLEIAQCVRKVQKAGTYEGMEMDWRGVWANGSQVYAEFCKKKNVVIGITPRQRVEEHKALYTKYRREAVEEGVIFQGRKDLHSYEIHHIPSGVPVPPKYAPEDYFMINPECKEF